MTDSDAPPHTDLDPPDSFEPPEGFEPEEKDLETAPPPELVPLPEAGPVPEAEPEETVRGLVSDAGRTLRLGALSVSNSQHYVESPPGQNKNPYGVWFGNDYQPWCAYFVSFCFDYASNRDHRVPWQAGYSGGIHQYAASKGWVVATPMAGDIFVYRNYQHTGLVTGGISLATGQFQTCEGNWGDKVSRIQRNYKTDGIGYYFVRMQPPA